MATNGALRFSVCGSIWGYTLFYNTERRMEMQKIISLVLVLVMCLSLCACLKECDCGCAYCCGENVKNIIETSVLPSQKPEEGITNPDRIEFSEPVLLAE